MALNIVQSVGNNQANSATVAATLTGVTAGNTILAICSAWEPGAANGLPTSVAATGLTFVTDQDGSQPTNVALRVSRASAVPAGNYTVTATYDAGSYPSIVLLEVEATGNVTPKDVGAGSGASDNSTTVGPTSATGSTPELVIAAVCASSPDQIDPGFVQPSGYTNIQILADMVSSTAYSVDYKIALATGTQSATWGTLNGTLGNQVWAAAIVAYEDESVGPTKFWLRNTSDNPLAATQFDMYKSPGAANATSVTNTTAGGTLIQTTQTSGGSLVEWVSEPLTAAVTVAGAINFNIPAREGATGNNAGLKARVYRRTSAGVETQIGADFVFPQGGITELTTTVVARTSVQTPGAGVALAITDRLLVRLYAANVGTMGAGSPGVTIQYNNTAALFDAYVQFTDGVVTTSQSTDANVNLTGVAGTGAVGNFAPTVAKTPAGVAGTGAVGTLSPTVAKTPTGVAATGAVGTPSLIISSSVTLTGVAATGAVGSPVPGVAPSVVGVAGTGAVGTLGKAIAVTPAGVAATGQVGTPAPGVAPSVVGVAGTGAVGTIGKAVAVTLTGVAATGEAGTVSISVAGNTNVNLSGVAATGAAGVPTVNLDSTATLTGVQATGAAGTATVQVGDSATITGVSADGAVGAVAVVVAKTLPGVAATAQVGSIGPSVSKTVAGVQATGAAGTPTVRLDSTATLAGVSATGAVGSVSISAAGNITVNLGGVSASGAAGSLTASIDQAVTLPGVSATGTAGTLGAAIAVTLPGVAAVGQAGVLQGIPVRLVNLTGVAATSAVGTVGKAVAPSMPGVSATGLAGILGPAVGILLAGVQGVGEVGTLATFEGIPTAIPRVPRPVAVGRGPCAGAVGRTLRPPAVPR